MAKRKRAGGRTPAKPARKAKTRPAAKSRGGPAAGKLNTGGTGRRKPRAGVGPRAKSRPVGTGSRSKRPQAATGRKSATAKGAGRRPTGQKVSAARSRPARLDRSRRTLDDVPTPPSSLDMNRRGSAVRTGRAEMAERRDDHANMTPAITGGDVDASVENAYFSGDEAPGGDNPTPDQDIVDDIGRAIGVEYQDNEELRSSDKVIERDRHRWELDPASAEDYKERK